MWNCGGLGIRIERRLGHLYILFYIVLLKVFMIIIYCFVMKNISLIQKYVYIVQKGKDSHLMFSKH